MLLNSAFYRLLFVNSKCILAHELSTTEFRISCVLIRQNYFLDHIRLILLASKSAGSYMVFWASFCPRLGPGKRFVNFVWFSKSVFIVEALRLSETQGRIFNFDSPGFDKVLYHTHLPFILYLLSDSPFVFPSLGDELQFFPAKFFERTTDIIGPLVFLYIISLFAGSIGACS